MLRKGLQCLKGLQGIEGHKGLKGLKGHKGKGLKENMGHRGLKGNKGLKGLEGLKPDRRHVMLCAGECHWRWQRPAGPSRRSTAYPLIDRAPWAPCVGGMSECMC